MLVEGRWVADADATIKDGAYMRAASAFDQDLPKSLVPDIIASQGRYALIASFSCPWSHRVLLLRALKGLEQQLPLLEACEPRLEGYALDARNVASRLGLQHIEHLHQLYTLSDREHTGRATVPVIWDILRKQIVSNDSARIMRAFDAADGDEGYTLVPGDHLTDIDALNQSIHDGLANAVYRAGLAQNQGAYDAAVDEVFATLQQLETRLSRNRYLFGRTVSETDWRLFATLVRFDAVYATHFRCTRRRLVDHPNLWAYARDLYAWPGIAETVDFETILRGYYINDGDNNPHGIIADRPDANWLQPHDRARFGAAQVWSRKNGPADSHH
jgi:putative glutathione S-transferase